MSNRNYALFKLTESIKKSLNPIIQKYIYLLKKIKITIISKISFFVISI